MKASLLSLQNYIPTLGVAKRVGPNGPARQPVLEGTGWVEDFNPSARSGPSRPARQLHGPNGPKYGPARPGPLARFKKKIK